MEEKGSDSIRNSQRGEKRMRKKRQVNIGGQFSGEYGSEVFHPAWMETTYPFYFFLRRLQLPQPSSSELGCLFTRFSLKN